MNSHALRPLTTASHGSALKKEGVVNESADSGDFATSLHDAEYYTALDREHVQKLEDNIF